MTGGPGKEHGTNKPPPTRRVQERSKGDTTSPTTSQNPSLWHPSWLNKACTTRKDSESEQLAKDNLEPNPITIKPETTSHVTKQFSWVPLPYCSPPGRPFPIKPLALSAHVSPQTIHFRVLDKSPVLGPGWGPPSCNTLATWCEGLTHLKRPWSWERLKAGGEGDDRGWDGWMASLTQRTWVWASSRSSSWTGKPGMLQSLESQRVRHTWVTELN